MVDKADVVVCAFNGKSGGTAYTVDYALKQNKIVIQIDSETSEVPQFFQRTEDGRKRPAPVMRKESGNVFKEEKARSFNAGNPSDFKEQRSSGIFKAPSLSGYRKTLTEFGSPNSEITPQIRSISGRLSGTIPLASSK